MLRHRSTWPVPLPKSSQTRPSSGLMAIRRPTAVGMNKRAVQLPVGSPAAATGAPEGVRASKAGVVASALAVPAAGAGASGPGPAVVASADSLALVSVLAARD